MECVVLRLASLFRALGSVPTSKLAFGFAVASTWQDILLGKRWLESDSMILSFWRSSNE
jgi:hypothetical protein